MILGISAGFHDAGVCVLDRDGNIQFATHSERFSKNKHDRHLCKSILDRCFEYPIEHVAYYERPWMHNMQQWISGQTMRSEWSLNGTLKTILGDHWNRNLTTSCYPHHLSHAAAGFQTSPYDDATVVVIDAIGELDTISIYHAYYDCKGRARYKKLWGQRYPHSIGLFYSAITQRVGLRPMDEEYITMGMAAFGHEKAKSLMNNNMLESQMKQRYFYEDNKLQFRENFHTGIDASHWEDYSNEEIAFAAQTITEELIQDVMCMAAELGKSKNLVYMGGVALNCVANRNVGFNFDNVWIMPNPGDAGSGLGCAALHYGKRVNWQHPYIGTCIEGEYPVNELLDELLTNRIVGVAAGGAEFGPRALGNRSLLADPRGDDIKDLVNTIKKRQKFRPFAPVILEEYADQYFAMPKGFSSSPYMQVTAYCKHPELYPAIVHIDGTSRVQTVPKDSASGIRKLLEKWYVLTDCPMLLNTSLNIRGEPMVDTVEDAQRFEKLYNTRVCTPTDSG